MSIPRARLAAAVLALVTLAGATAQATPTPADKEVARKLALRGYELFEARSYTQAIESFQGAEERFHAPTHLLYIARCQVKLEKLLEARASYDKLLEEKLGHDAPAPFRDAIESGRRELVEVEALTPQLTLTAASGGPAPAAISLDGQPFPASGLGRPFRQNPGLHAVVATAPGFPPFERTVFLKLGTPGETVALELEPPPRPSLAPPIVAFSLGAVGLGVGTAGAILATRSPASAGKLHAMEIAGFATGAVGVAAGIVLVVLRPRSPSAPGVSMSLGAGSIEIGAKF